jgi:hypothetical protein
MSSDVSNYAATIDNSRMSNAAARGAISTLVIAVSSLSDQSRVMPLLDLIGEFTAKASQAGL